MSRRTAAIKKTLVLLALGGAAFHFAIPFGVPFGDSGGCIRNADLVTFYQGVGGNSIEAFRAATANAVGNDMAQVVINPTAGLATNMYNNWVAQRFPLDLDVTGVVRQ